jgi:predicted ATPase/class 3 adenylate cyclase
MRGDAMSPDHLRPNPTTDPSAVAARAREPIPDARKTVTVLFADIVDSSRLSLSLDPEALRNLLARYFNELSAVIRRHGGMVDNYIGDAIMAVFGVPTISEDDALRAVRAAVEMRDTLARLNDELEAGWGVRLVNRIGINTGEVITGDQTQEYLSVAGDAVVVAKRLEEAATADEILIGVSTHKLVRDAVVVKPSGPRALKRGATIHALAVLQVLAHTPGVVRRFDAPFVGRERQRALLETVFRNAVGDRTCHLVTILADAGVGKSRLVWEFTRGLAEDVTVLHGRCLPYGEGITYWPLAEIARGLARAEGSDSGEHVAAAIGSRLAGEEKAGLIVERVVGAVGLGGTEGTAEETAWAVRKLFEALARAGPLVVVVDDIHWAEPTFLDLIEHIADFSRDFPILLICIARPELFDTRPGWGAGKRNATSIVLERLSDEECRELISNLLGHAPLPLAAESRIASAAEGNPLFAEEFVAMLVDDELLRRAPDSWIAASELAALPVPSTINALLAARLEGISSLERAILTTGAVEGSVFHESALRQAARSAPDTLEEGLRTLVRRDLIRPESSLFAGEKAYRFRHALIRDAAYNSLTKNARADLHERIAGWLETVAADRLREFEEIVGYHLEQAFLYRVALGPRDAHASLLAVRACGPLEAAGRRALVRSDLPAAISLLERASRLLSTNDPRRIALLAELSGAMIESGRLDDAGRALDEAERLSNAADDQRLAAHVLVQRHFLRIFHGEEDGLEEAARAAAAVIPVFEQLGDDLGLCRARRLEAWLSFTAGRGEAAIAAWEQAAAHAQRAGDRHGYYEILTWIASVLWFGPTPATEGIRRCEALREEVRESAQSEAAILRQLACLNAIVGHFSIARELIAASNATYADLGLTLYVASSEHEALIELLAGNPAAAERSARAAYRTLEEMGERYFRSTMAASLAVAIMEQGRYEAAEEFATHSAELAASGDLITQVLWRRVRARVLIHRSQIDPAETLAREAVKIAEATDFINDRADALIDLSHVLEAACRSAEAVDATSRAMRLYEQKGNVVAAATTRLRLGELI